MVTVYIFHRHWWIFILGLLMIPQILYLHPSSLLLSKGKCLLSTIEVVWVNIQTIYLANNVFFFSQQCFKQSKKVMTHIFLGVPCCGWWMTCVSQDYCILQIQQVFTYLLCLNRPLSQIVSLFTRDQRAPQCWKCFTLCNLYTLPYSHFSIVLSFIIVQVISIP